MPGKMQISVEDAAAGKKPEGVEFAIAKWRDKTEVELKCALDIPVICQTWLKPYLSGAIYFDRMDVSYSFDEKDKLNLFVDHYLDDVKVFTHQVY